MDAVFQILRSLKMTPGKGLYFKKNSNRDVEVYSDADWASSLRILYICMGESSYLAEQEVVHGV